VGQAFALYARQDILCEERKVGAWAAIEFWRNRMRPHECGDDVGRAGFRQLAHRMELAHLRVQVEAIAGFALHRGCSHGEHRFEALSAAQDQVFQSGGAGGEHAVLDTSAPPVDVHVRHPAGAPEKFFLAPSCKDEVCVAVDKAWYRGAPFGVVGRSVERFPGDGRIGAAQQRFFADPCDAAVLDVQTGAAYFLYALHCGTCGCGLPLGCPKLPDVMDEIRCRIVPAHV
jgi:hypothetical protein